MVVYMLQDLTGKPVIVRGATHPPHMTAAICAWPSAGPAIGPLRRENKKARRKQSRAERTEIAEERGTRLRERPVHSHYSRRDPNRRSDSGLVTDGHTLFRVVSYHALARRRETCTYIDLLAGLQFFMAHPKATLQERVG